MNPPNSPCECGSGKKQKRCHPFGAPVQGPGVRPKTLAEKKEDRRKELELKIFLAGMGGMGFLKSKKGVLRNIG